VSSYVAVDGFGRMVIDDYLTSWDNSLQNHAQEVQPLRLFEIEQYWVAACKVD
jgi:hypothetical protein